MERLCRACLYRGFESRLLRWFFRGLVSVQERAPLEQILSGTVAYCALSFIGLTGDRILIQYCATAKREFLVLKEFL